MKIGLVVPNLTASHKNMKLIEEVNKIHRERNDTDIIVFCEINFPPVFPIEFSVMPLIDAYAYPGNLVATNLLLAYKILNFPGTQNKYFYIWDLEWMHLNNKSYKGLRDIYNNRDLNILTRSISHKHMVEQCWDRPVLDIVENFDMNKLIQVIENKNGRTN